MKEIKLLAEHIEDELEDARTYAKLALEYKTSDPETAQIFYKLSGEEMGHQEMLHRCAARLIEDYRRTSGEAPEAMDAVYNFMHERFVEQAERVVNLQNMFRK